MAIRKHDRRAVKVHFHQLVRKQDTTQQAFPEAPGIFQVCHGSPQ